MATVNAELETIWEEAVVLCIKTLPKIFLDDLRKIWKTLSQVSCSGDQIRTRELRVLTAGPRR
jgi:hypothetical protein